MATSTITNTVLDATGAAVASCPVTITLQPRGCFRIDTQTEIAPVYRTTTNASGIWTAALERTANISPANSFYVVEEALTQAQGGSRKYSIQVGASNATLLASLVSPISDATALGYLTQAAADARYVQAPGSFATVGNIAESKPNTAAAAGVLTTYARGDHAHKREITYGTNAARLALTGTDLYEGLLWRNTDTFRLLYTYRNATWLPSLDCFYVADATARLAVANPYEGMQVYQADNNLRYSYDSAAWRGLQTTSGTSDGTAVTTSGAARSVCNSFTIPDQTVAGRVLITSVIRVDYSVTTDIYQTDIACTGTPINYVNASNLNYNVNHTYAPMTAGASLAVTIGVARAQGTGTGSTYAASAAPNFATWIFVPTN